MYVATACRLLVDLRSECSFRRRVTQHKLRDLAVTLVTQLSTCAVFTVKINISVDTVYRRIREGYTRFNADLYLNLIPNT